MTEKEKKYFYAQIDFIPTMLKYMFIGSWNYIPLYDKTHNSMYYVYAGNDGYFRRVRFVDDEPHDEKFQFTIFKAIEMAAQLEHMKSEYPEQYANKKEEIKGKMKEYYAVANGDIMTNIVS